MGGVISLFRMILVVYPTWFAVFFFGFLALLLIFIVIKIVGFILEAVPFL